MPRRQRSKSPSRRRSGICYTKVIFWRDPYDTIISRYYWEKADAAGIPFGQFVRQLPGLLTESPIRSRTTVILLRRDLAKQCASYVGRNDFMSITIRWQWYLDMGYSNLIVDPAHFLPQGQAGCAIWYALEIEARCQLAGL